MSDDGVVRVKNDKGNWVTVGRGQVDFSAAAEDAALSAASVSKAMATLAAGINAAIKVPPSLGTFARGGVIPPMSTKIEHTKELPELAAEIADITGCEVKVYEVDDPSFEPRPIFRVLGARRGKPGSDDNKPGDNFDYIITSTRSNSATSELIVASTQDARDLMEARGGPLDGFRVEEIGRGDAATMSDIVPRGIDMPIYTKLVGTLRREPVVYCHISECMSVGFAILNSTTPRDGSNDFVEAAVYLNWHSSYAGSTLPDQTKQVELQLQRDQPYCMRDLLMLVATRSQVNLDMTGNCFGCGSFLKVAYEKYMSAGISTSNMLAPIVMREMRVCPNCAKVAMTNQAAERRLNLRAEEYQREGSVPNF